jgi:hypothetical protein
MLTLCCLEFLTALTELIPDFIAVHVVLPNFKEVSPPAYDKILTQIVT